MGQIQTSEGVATAVIRRAWHGGGPSNQDLVLLAFLVEYTGSAWRISPSHEGLVVVSGDVSMPSTVIVVALTSHTIQPIVHVTQALATNYYFAQAEAVSASEINIKVYNVATDSQVTTPDTSMRFNVFCGGR